MNLEKIRKEKRISQTEIAKILNISQGSYSNYENGKREPDIKTLIKLSQIFNTSIDNLIKENADKVTQGQHPIYQEELLNEIIKLNQIECLKVKAYIEGLKAGKKEYEQEKMLNKYKEQN